MLWLVPALNGTKSGHNVLFPNIEFRVPIPEACAASRAPKRKKGTTSGPGRALFHLHSETDVIRAQEVFPKHRHYPKVVTSGNG